jgi:hypothetical protein
MPAGALASGPLLMHILDWHAAFLRSYQGALRDHALTGPLDDYLRLVARTLMGTYLEIAKSIPEAREQMLALHTALVSDSLAKIEDLKRGLRGAG